LYLAELQKTCNNLTNNLGKILRKSYKVLKIGTQYYINYIISESCHKDEILRFTAMQPAKVEMIQHYTTSQNTK